MDREQNRRDRTTELITEFPRFVALYDQITPFTRSGQLELHRETIAIRREHSTPGAAIADRRFIEPLYGTLRSWGIGTRASVLVPIEQFAAELSEWAPTFDALANTTIDSPGLDTKRIADTLWQAITGIDIVENKSKLVALSKTIHHVLPDLLPPIDRAYTQKFFVWQTPEFQNQQERVFRSMWDQFARIAREVDLISEVGSEWRTSRTKVIDNAIIAFVRDREVGTPAPRRPLRPVGDLTQLDNTHSVRELYDKLDEFRAELEDAGLKPNTVNTYSGRSKTFVDWLAGRYQPQGPNRRG